MSDKTMSMCCTCGFEWQTGRDGSHSCSEHLLDQIEQKDKEIRLLTEYRERNYDIKVEMNKRVGKLQSSNAYLVKSSRLISDYLENHYKDVDGVAECRRVADKYEDK